MPVELEAEPAGVSVLFGTRVELVRAFARDLAQYGETLGLIGPLELPRLWSRHILNSALLTPLMRPGRVGDIGSGAGFPGLVLAIARPDVQFVLLEPMEGRAEWLNKESAELGLVNVEVILSRAEEAGLKRSLDQVTARAVSALRKLIPISVPLARSGGELVFLKGASVSKELDEAHAAIRKARLHDVELLVLGEGIVHEKTRVFRARVD